METLSAVYQATEKNMIAVSSLAVDNTGNVYAGLSPSCSVLRIAPDGAVKQLMTGAGKDNKHVLALAMLGEDLYAATGLAGGIYRINAPASSDPDVTIVYAREDMRTRDKENAGPVQSPNRDGAKQDAGPESLAVTSLTAGSDGALYAVAAFPAQLLKLTARSEGSYLSPVLHASATAKWGTLRVVADNHDGDTRVMTRSGASSEADAAWNAWNALDGEKSRQCTGAVPATLRVADSESRRGPRGRGNIHALSGGPRSHRWWRSAS